MILFTKEKANILIHEYKRPWKVVTLVFGIALMVLGSYYYPAPDWDVPICFIMGLLAYLTASWSMHVIVERRWKYVPFMLFYTWFTVDGSYWIYWHFKDPAVLAYMREVNFPASLCMYGLCGLVWYFNGSLKELFSWKREK